MDEAVVGSCPEHAVLLGRFRQAENDVVILDGVLIFCDGTAGILLLGLVVAREVRANRGPGAALIHRTENELRGVIDNIGIVLRNEDRHGPGVAVFLSGSRVTIRNHRPLLDALGLIGAAIEPSEDWALVVGVNDVGIAGIHGNRAAFTAADGIPVAAIDEAAVAARADSDGGVVLLGAIDAIQKFIVGSNVIKLRRWLVTLRGPIFSAIYGDRCAAIVSVNHAQGILGINPQSVMIAMRCAQPFERLAAIHGAEEPGVRDEDGVYIFRISPDMGEIPGALAEAVVVGNERPVLATVVRAIEPAFLSFDERVDDIRIGAGDGHADAPERAFGDAVAFDALPGGTVVVRTEEAVLGATAIERPGSAVALPHGGEENVGIAGIEYDVNAAGAIVKIEDFFPVLAAVASSEDAAFGVRAIGMAQSGDEYDVWIRGMNDEFADVPGVLQSDIGPSLAGVIRTIDAVAEGDISADASFAGSRVNDVGIGIGDRDAADGGGGLFVEERIPGDAAVRGFPNTAGNGAKVIGIGLARDTGDGQDPAAAKGTDQAPLHAGVGFWINGRSGGRTSGLLRANGTGRQEVENKRRNTEANKAARRFHKNLRN